MSILDEIKDIWNRTVVSKYYNFLNIDFAAVAKYLIQFLYTVEDNICVVAI